MGARMLDILQQMLRDGDASVVEISDWLGISEESLTRPHQVEHLTAEQRNYLRRLVKITAAASKAFGDRERASKWLRRENRALGGAVPVRLISTEQGFEQVQNVLARIEYGGIS
jgi:putative toxin-antitoxin system antitoxin component (TIGR02293 family)